MDINSDRLAKTRDKLMPPSEREDFIRTYGEAARQILESLLDDKAAKLIDSYQRSWATVLGSAPDPDEMHLITETEASELVALPVAAIRRLKAAGLEHELGQQLLSHSDAAKMLGCSVATVKRLVSRGDIPEPVQISEKRIGHRLSDVEAFISNGPQKQNASR